MRQLNRKRTLFSRTPSVFFRFGPACRHLHIIYGALVSSMTAGLPLQGSPWVGCCCQLLLSASISCCQLHSAAVGCSLHMSHYCSGFRLWLWPLWLSLRPSLRNLCSEISTEALACDQMWWSLPPWCSLPLAVLLPLRCACHSPSDAAVSKFPLLYRS